MNTDIHHNEIKRKMTVLEKYNSKFHCSMKSTFGVGTLYISKERLCFAYNGFMKKKYVIIEMKQITNINKTSQKTIEVIELSGQSHHIKSHKKINEIYNELNTYWLSNKKNKNLLNKSPSVRFPDNAIESFPDKSNENTNQKYIPILKRLVHLQSNDIQKKIFDNVKEIELLYKHCGSRNITIEELQQQELTDKKLIIRFKGISDIVGLETRIEEQFELKQLTNGFQIQTMTKANDIPYSSYFVIESLVTITDESDGCVFSVGLNINFSKSTIWRKKIVETSTKEYINKFVDWIEYFEHRIGVSSIPIEPRLAIENDEVFIPSSTSKEVVVDDSNDYKSTYLFNIISLVLFIFIVILFILYQ